MEPEARWDTVVFATGTQTWRDRRLVAKALYAIESQEPKGTRFCLVQCGRNGAEFLARDLALGKRWHVLTFRDPSGKDATEEALRATQPHHVLLFHETTAYTAPPAIDAYARSPESPLKQPPCEVTP
jgi:hypothetical protein